MRRLGAVLLLVLLVAGMNVRSVWSGGGKWGSGTPSGARTDAYWLPDGQTPTGKPFPDVAIGGTLYTTSLQSASWSLGVSDVLADLSPNTASVSLVGQVTSTQGDDLVISTGLGTMFAGRVDTVTQTRDAAGDWWTTVTATDRIGALGAASLRDYSLTTGTVVAVGPSIALEAGVVLEMTDVSGGALPDVNTAVGVADPYSGALLPYINEMARSSNAMLALTRTGSISVATRTSTTPSSVLTLSGVNAPQSWSLSYSIDMDINQWVFNIGAAEQVRAHYADIDARGLREWSATGFGISGSALSNVYTDWYTYGGSQRPTASGTLIVSDFTQDDLILLDPFQWVTESGTDWQVLSVQHSVTASPYSWTVSITADNLLDLL